MNDIQTRALVPWWDEGFDSRTCQHCGAELTTRGRRSADGVYFCNRNRNPECAAAGAAYRNRQKTLARRVPCSNCGDSISPRRDAHGIGQFCTKVECRRARNRIRMKKYAADKRADGVDIFAPYRAAAYAKRRARMEAGEIPRTAPWTDARREAHQRRRALKAGATVEEFTNKEIFERDGYVCGICELDVDPELKWPDPGMASLDHIVPLIKGGAHSRANTQCSHLYCNLVKHDRDSPC